MCHMAVPLPYRSLNTISLPSSLCAALGKNGQQCYIHGHITGFYGVPPDMASYYWIKGEAEPHPPENQGGGGEILSLAP
jgi:hypothetical protein